MKSSGDETPQLLPMSSIQSIVTISNNSKEPLKPAVTQRQGRSGSDFNWYRHEASVSMITIPYDGKDVTMVATCTPPTLRYSNPSDGRITLVTYISDRNTRKRGTVNMKYSEKGGSQYKAVCLVPKEDSAVLLAIDTTGKLHCCNLSLQESDVKRRILNLRECELNGNNEQLEFMNNLTVRQEICSGYNGSQAQSTQSSTQCNTSQTPIKKNQKRKRGDPKKNSSPVKADPDASSLSSQGMYVVVSSLNSPLPSDAAPIIMYMSSRSSETNEWECTPSVTIPIDQACIQMKCIAFLSRDRCGALWNSISSVVMKDEDLEADCDSGIVLMGFQDGSLRAVIVYNQTPRNGKVNVTLQTSQVATLLAGCGQAPLLSLDLISPPSSCENESPILVCCRENRSVTLISSTLIHQQPTQCDYRVVSMNLLRYDSSSAALTFLGVYDTGMSFLLRAVFTISSGSVLDWKNERMKLSLPSGQFVTTPRVQYTNSESDYLFAMPQSNGKVTLFKMLSKIDSHNEGQSSSEDVKSPILAHLSKSNSCGKLMIQQPKATMNKLSTYESLVKKLQSSAAANDKTSNTNTPKATVSLGALREIRDAIRASSYIMTNFGRRSDSAPWRLEGGKITVDENALVKLNMNSWDLATHAIHVHPGFSMPDPVCYRIAGGGCGFTKVLYGGTVRSIAAGQKSTSDQSTEIRVPNRTTATIIYSSLQKTYSSDCKTWYQSKSIVDSPNEIAAAYTSSSVVHLASV